MIEIKNKDCIEYMNELKEKSIDLVITSPPYNMGRSGKGSDLNIQYDDNRYWKDYNDWIVNIFKCFDMVVKDDGIVCWNIAMNTSSINGLQSFLFYQSRIVEETGFILCDVLVWEKSTGLFSSKSVATRRKCEFVYIWCKKDYFKMHRIKQNMGNKKENIDNIIKDETKSLKCKYNGAVFTQYLVNRLIYIYGVYDNNKLSTDMNVLDPFSGSGTVASVCKKLNCNFYGSELDKNCYEFSLDRLKGFESTEVEYVVGGLF